MNPIVGIGELLWDVFPDGRKVAGGAPFNFAFHCRQLGHDAVIVSRVGDDELGRELRAEVRRLGLTDEFIQTDRDHPTGTVRVTVDAAGVPSYEIVDDVAWDYIGWSDSLERLATETVAVNYGTLCQRGPDSRNTIHEFTQRTPGLRVFDVNLRSSAYDFDDWFETWELVVKCGKRCNWFKASIEDLAEVYRFFDQGPRYAPKTLFGDYVTIGLDQRKLAIITYGPKGCEVTDWQRTYHERGVAAKVVDTVGAGDSFLAALVCSHLEGRSLKATMRFALHYSARVCEVAGATPAIDRDEVEIALLDDPWMRGQ